MHVKILDGKSVLGFTEKWLEAKTKITKSPRDVCCYFN